MTITSRDLPLTAPRAVKSTRMVSLSSLVRETVVLPTFNDRLPLLAPAAAAARQSTVIACQLLVRAIQDMYIHLFLSLSVPVRTW